MVNRWGTVFALLILSGVYADSAFAAADRFTLSGARQKSSSATTCAAEFGDAYDTFCASDPGGHSTCVCDSYNANLIGNLTGSVSDSSATMHVTRDTGASVDTPDCQPLWGEVTFAASKDTETIYLNGAQCAAQANGGSALTGGFGIFSSTSGLKAAGTFRGTINSDDSYTLKFSGTTAK